MVVHSLTLGVLRLHATPGQLRYPVKLLFYRISEFLGPHCHAVRSIDCLYYCSSR